MPSFRRYPEKDRARSPYRVPIPTLPKYSYFRVTAEWRRRLSRHSAGTRISGSPVSSWLTQLIFVLVIICSYNCEEHEFDANSDKESKFVMNMILDLKLYEHKYPILKDVFGDTVKPTFGQIINLIVLANRAFPGIDFSFLDHVKPFEGGTMTLEDGTDVALPVGQNLAETAHDLAQLVSMLHLPSSYNHTEYDALLQDRAHVVEHYEQLYSVPSVPQIDFTYNNNNMQISNVTAEGTEMDFKPVEEVVNIDTLVDKPILLTTKASPSTLCLFGNMGPTPYSKDSIGSPGVADKTNPATHVMSYFSQPSFNMRSRVERDRLERMWKTCAELDDQKRNLITHNVCIVPYIIRHTVCYLTNKHTLSDTDTTQDEPRDVSATNSVLPCFYNTHAGDKNLCGDPVALPLEMVGQEVPTGSTLGTLRDLFHVLLGYSWKTVVNCSDKVITNLHWDTVGDEGTNKYVRLREMVISWLLIQLVDQEYQGFRFLNNWQTLHSRLTVNHAPYVSGLATPTTVRNLIYQCLVLIQATSPFRLAFLGGLGRHFGVVHSLLGVDPSLTTLP